MNENEFAELSAGHALHALSDVDERRYAAALAAHPQWQAIADADVETAQLLADASSTVEPPAGIRSALLAQIATMPQDDGLVAAPAAEAAPDAQEPFMRPPRRWGRAVFALAACLVLLVGVGFGVAALTSQLTTPASIIALDEIQSAADAQQASVELESGAIATAHWSPSVGSAVLVADGLEPLSDEQTYELWYVRGDEPVPAGVFDADAGETTALLEGAMQDGDVIAVTVEQAGGSPTGQPTSDPIVAIPTA